MRSKRPQRARHNPGVSVGEYQDIAASPACRGFQCAHLTAACEAQKTYSLRCVAGGDLFGSVSRTVRRDDDFKMLIWVIK
jgi:hypothetical protein